MARHVGMVLLDPLAGSDDRITDHIKERGWLTGFTYAERKGPVADDVMRICTSIAGHAG